MELLKKLCEIHAPSGEEYRLKDFILNYVIINSNKWKNKPVVISKNIQDSLILVFGKPKLAVFAHMDSVGFTVRYNNQLVRIGSPVTTKGISLQGFDENELVSGTLEIDEENNKLSVNSDKIISPGTSLVFSPTFKESKEFVVSPFLDNRLGVWNCLKLAETLENGILVFSSWEEHGGGSVELLARLIYKKYKIKKALISDITWVTEGVLHGKGAVVSIRDKNIPRRIFINEIIQVLKREKLNFQLEVEESGSSDGGYLQKTPYPIDWCFIGAPEDNVHSFKEKVHKQDIKSMLAIFLVLMKELNN